MRQQEAEFSRIVAALDAEAARVRGASAEGRAALDTDATLAKLRGEADAARRELSRLRRESAGELVALKSRKAGVSAIVATVLGAAAAAVGLRVLEGLAPEGLEAALGGGATQLFWLRGVDVTLTALLLAGGADGLHRILGQVLRRRRELAAPA